VEAAGEVTVEVEVVAVESAEAPAEVALEAAPEAAAAEPVEEAPAAAEPVVEAAPEASEEVATITFEETAPASVNGGGADDTIPQETPAEQVAAASAEEAVV